jgi:hypothetical protein
VRARAAYRCGFVGVAIVVAWGALAAPAGASVGEHDHLRFMDEYVGSERDDTLRGTAPSTTDCSVPEATTSSGTMPPTTTWSAARAPTRRTAAGGKDTCTAEHRHSC